MLVCGGRKAPYSFVSPSASITRAAAYLYGALVSVCLDMAEDNRWSVHLSPLNKAAVVLLLTKPFRYLIRQERRWKFRWPLLHQYHTEGQSSLHGKSYPPGSLW